MARTLSGDKLEKELARLEQMREYENTYAACAMICGIDEAGRGPLAGPVAAGAVILPKDCILLYLNDSKKLSEKRREELFVQIKEQAVAWCVGIVGPERIDEINDAVEIPGVDIMQVPIIKGDAKSVSIAAASILAKVTRDHMMVEYDQLFPDYGFAKHKGYGTAAHIQAIQELGPCPIHRRSFIRNIWSEEAESKE